MRRARVATSLLATAAITFGLAGAAAGGNGHGQGHKTPGSSPPVTDPAGVIDLPAGHTYKVLARDCVDQVTSTESGATFGMPADFDANITVRGKGGTVQLLSAHELTKPVAGDFQGDAGKCHVDEQAKADDGDSDGWASVSRLTLGKDGTTVTKRELITTGLHDLCAGGRTPWGTMLVNEEFPFLQGAGKDRSGWVWEIDPETGAQKRATGMGRMSHEQEAVSRGAWYITDDRGNFQYLYKFVPDKRRDLSKGKLYGLNFDRATNTGEWVGPLDPMDPEGDFAKMSHPDNIRYDREGNLFIFEDNGSALDTNPATGGNNEVYVLPKGRTGSENLRKFATIRGGGEGTGPWFSRHGKLLYLSIQDQAQPDGSDSRVLAITMKKAKK